MGQTLSRREVRAAAAAGVVFLTAAVALWIAGGTPAPGMTGLWLALLSMLLSGVTFQVGKGKCSPLMLAVVPMLLLVPGPVIPLLIVGAQFAGRFVSWLARGRRDPGLLLLPFADSMFVLAPALLVTLVVPNGDVGTEVLLVAATFALWLLSDVISWPLVLWYGRRIDPREEIRAAVWIYALDAMLVPIAFAIAVAASEYPAAPAAILPLAALLWFFARERSNRVSQAATLQTILQHASDLILIVERDGRVRRVLGASATLIGDDASGGRLLDHIHSDDALTVRRFLAVGHGEAEFRLLHADGSYRHVAAVAADLTGDVRVRGLVLTVRDDESRRVLRHRASHDPLTGLANRMLFDERLAEAAAPAVLFIDLDAFKAINDRLGHAAGDEVLRIAARRLQTCVRSTDTVARLGGDEFALLVEAGSEDEVSARVGAVFADPFNVAGELLAVSASVGVAVGGEDVLDAADRAMYAVKRGHSRDDRLPAAGLGSGDRRGPGSR